MALITGDVATDTRNTDLQVREIADKVVQLEPDEAPLTVFTQRMNKVRMVRAPKVEWLENEREPFLDVATASAASNATTIGVSNGNYFRIGDVVRFQAGDALEVTATAAGSISGTRGIGTVTAAAVASGDELVIIGNVNAEGATLRQIKTQKVVTQSNFCQIQRTPFGVTGTEAATTQYGGPELTRLEADKAVENLRLWEKTALFGVKREDTSVTGAPKRFSGGLTEFITTNVTSSVGTLTEATLQTFLRSGFRYGSGRKVLLASPLVVAAIEGFARSKIQVLDRAQTFGVTMKNYVSGQGEIDIVMIRWLNDSTTYKGSAFLVDMDAVSRAMLRDIKLLRERQPNDADKIEHEYLGEGCFVFEHERKFAKMTGVTG